MMHPDSTMAVYQILDPFPLEANRKDLYVDLGRVRNADPITLIQRAIQYERLGEVCCRLLAGQRGSGKSTELKLLASRLEEGRDNPRRCFCVYCETADDLDPNDIDIPELLPVVLRRVAEEFRTRLGIELTSSLVNKRLSELVNVLKAPIELDKVSWSVGLAGLSTAIRQSPSYRQEARKALEPRLGSWIEAVNDVLVDARSRLPAKGYDDLVLMVDDLDKMIIRGHESTGCTTAEYLFVHRAPQLTGLRAHVVYTIPLALAYSSREQELTNIFRSRTPVLPMVKVLTPPPEPRPHEAGREALRDILRKRLRSVQISEDEVFAGGALDLLLDASGGQPRELMLLARDALIQEGLPIAPAAAKKAIVAARRSYARQLRAEHTVLLEEVRRTGKIVRTRENEDDLRELLDSRAILQYVNDEEWYGVNPLADPEGWR